MKYGSVASGTGPVTADACSIRIGIKAEQRTAVAFKHSSSSRVQSKTLLYRETRRLYRHQFATAVASRVYTTYSTSTGELSRTGTSNNILRTDSALSDILLFMQGVAIGQQQTRS